MRLQHFCISFTLFSFISEGNAAWHDPYPGVLLNITFRSVIGTLLPGDHFDLSDASRQAFFNGITSPPSGYWIDKAKRQIRHTFHRQVYRRSYLDDQSKGQLVLTPESVWKIKIDPDENGLRVIQRGTKKFIAVQYSFQSVLIARRGSVYRSEESLGTDGGTWSDKWQLPLDPDYVFQQTKYSCIDETRNSFTEVTAENAWHFYDDKCDASRNPNENDQCHLKHGSSSSCRDALRQFTGAVTVEILWTRVPYSKEIADVYRVGNPENEGTRNLKNVPFKGFRIRYKYFRKTDCEYEELKCVRGYGWRRVLTFTTTALNTAQQRYLNIARLGDKANDTVFVKKGIYKWSTCANGFKHQNFTQYRLDERKTIPPVVTCIHDTLRLQNHEYSPLSTQYDSCDWQGISSGWAHQIISSTPCQWIDITRQTRYSSRTLVSSLNPSGYLCEGTPELSSRPRRPIFPDSSAADFANRPLCNYTQDYESDNAFSLTIRPQGTTASVTSRCPPARRHHGIYRNCGWTVPYESIPCTSGKKVTLNISHKSNMTDEPSLAIRICEVSRRLGNISVRCEHKDALASGAVAPTKKGSLHFTCPKSRDKVEVGNAFSILAAKFVPWESKRQVPKIQVEVTEI